MDIKPEQFKRVEDVFHEALQVEPSERASFLDETCRDDLELRAEVESLLAHANGESVGMHLSGDHLEQGTLIERGPVAEGPGSRIGVYKILQKIGEGGFGIVYMAEQQEPVKRKVALKIIKLGMDTKQVIARFEAERQALAMMDHPNISKVLDAGATETGRPYFVMELVKGISLADYCDKSNMQMRDRLELFLQVCHAIQHAHQKGIIHRDLKPSNVLVTLHDTRAVPMIIDFGIAKATSRQLTEKTLFTEFRQFIGTPEYMSPDQADISGLDVDTRTDIFSLGVILYELLTGTTPFDAETLRKAGYGEIQRIIKEEEPPKPSTRLLTLMDSGTGSDIAKHRQVEPGSISRLLRGDLDWIIMKAMEKDRTRRYQTASELAADIERFLKKLPVLAGPPSMIYKTRKFVLRHQLGVTAGLLIALALILGLSAATIGLFQARREAQRSQEIADFLQSLFVSTNPEEALASDVDVEHVLATAREVFGGDHATVAAVLSSRALQLQSSGELEAAEQLYQESLQLWRDRFGADNVNVGTTLGRLGMLQMTKGDEAGAEEALRESLRIMREQSGGESLVMCETMSVLATVMANQGKFDEAVELIKESIRLREERAPHQKLQIAIGYLGLGNTLGIAGRIDEALETAPETIQAWREAVPPDSLLLSRILLDYGAAYYRVDDHDAAESLLLEANDILSRSEENTNSYRSLVTRILFRLYEEREDFVSAIRIALEGVEFMEDDPDESSFDNAVRGLANLAWRIAAEPQRTEDEYRLALKAVERALVETPDKPAYLNTIGVLKYRFGEYEDALSVFAISNAFYAQEYEHGAPADLAFMAMAHFKLGQFDEARERMIKLRLAMNQTQFALDESNQMHLAEAEALLGDLMRESSPEP